MSNHKKLGATDHDYQNCLVGNFYSRDVNGKFESWEDFKKEYLGFPANNDIEPYDDTYHFVFRFDIHPIHSKDGLYELELCVMLQRKGIYSHLTIKNIDQETLDGEVRAWLEGRKQYLRNLWTEI